MQAPGEEPHYWSYKALLEDKKRCQSGIPHDKRVPDSSTRKESQDYKKSHKAMDELKRHMQVTLDKVWDPNGATTPSHSFVHDENMPHYSQKEFALSKKRLQTSIRKSASARRSDELGQCPTAGRIFSQEAPNDPPRREGPSIGPARSRADGIQEKERTAGNWQNSRRELGIAHWEPEGIEAPTMDELLAPGPIMDGGVVFDEKGALGERRSSSVPHNSQQVFNQKKKYCATKIHQRPSARRAQSARDLGQLTPRSYSDLDVGQYGETRYSPNQAGYETPRSSSDVNALRDPTSRSYQGLGNSSEAWPEGRPDPKKIGRYQSQAYFAIDKRRHAANVDGDAARERARLRNEAQHGAERQSACDDQGLMKPDFCARGDKYRSQYALAQHKRRHLATMHSDGDELRSTTPRNTYPNASIQQDLFTSQKNLEYGKKGHVVALNSARSVRKANRSQERGSVSSTSSCDVGKGISRMMHRHKEDQVHTSQVEFYLKKKNHATSVHQTPRPPRSCEGSLASESSVGGGVLVETRRASNPHNSCKAFALKKKYHQTNVHVKPDSRLRPDVMNDKPLDKQPRILDSQSHLNNLKKIHVFEYDPATRGRASSKPLPMAPVPRNGQWTPQHICD